MSFTGNLKLLENSIGSKDEHFLSYHVHQFRQSKKRLHPFVRMFCEALLDIEHSIPGYSEEMIGRISRYNGQDLNTIQQIYQVFAEVFIIRRVVQLADEAVGRPYAIHEPGEQEGRANPEIRSRIKGINFAVEVKTPQLVEHASKRHSNLQLTVRLPLRRITEGIDVINPIDNKIKSYLEDAQRKFDAYRSKAEFQNDYRLLFIVWDDYINEPISALLSPLSGLFTDQSFARGNDDQLHTYDLVDGVVLIRHLHQFHRILNDQEFVNGVTHAFQFYRDPNPFPPAFIQNPKGRTVPEVLLQGFDAIPPAAMFFVAEYKPTDWVDWRTGVGFTGLSVIPVEKHERFFSVMRNATAGDVERAIPDVVSFGTVNIERIAERFDLSDDAQFELFLEEARSVAEIAAHAQRNQELLERQTIRQEQLIREQILRRSQQQTGKIHTRVRNIHLKEAQEKQRKKNVKIKKKAEKSIRKKKH